MLKKFNSLEEAAEANWDFHPGPEYYERVRKFYEFASHFVTVKCPPGIYKFKTIEEANKHREEYHRQYLENKSASDPKQET